MSDSRPGPDTVWRGMARPARIPPGALRLVACSLWSLSLGCVAGGARPSSEVGTRPAHPPPVGEDRSTVTATSTLASSVAADADTNADANTNAAANASTNASAHANAKTDERVHADRPLWSPPDAPPRPHSKVLPDGAEEGPRIKEDVEAALKVFVESQKFGVKWQKRLRKQPPPEDQRGIGGAQSAAGLEHDPMEMQSQVQYVEDTDANLRFGVVSVRAQRIYRYGKLRAVRVVLERVGSGTPEEYGRDIEALREAWQQPVQALGLDDRFRVVRNDLVTPTKGPARDRGKVFRIDLEPTSRRKQ